MDLEERENMVQFSDKFCAKCGEKLEFTGPQVARYDQDTGQPIYAVSLMCPNTRLAYLLGRWRSSHDQILMDLHPDGTLHYFAGLESRVEILDRDPDVALALVAGG